MRYLKNNETVLSGRLFEMSMQKNRLSNEAFFKSAKSAGFSAVELRDSQILPGCDTEEIRALCEKYALHVAMLTSRTGRLNDEAGFKRFLEYLRLAEQLNCPRIKVSGNVPGLLRRAAEYAESCGIRIGINNHIGTGWETPEETFRMLEMIGHPNFYCHFDPSHWYLAKARWNEAVLKELLPKIDYFIVQDYTESPEFPSTGKRHVRMCSAEEQGCVGYPEVAGILEKLHYSGPVALVALRDVENNTNSIHQFFERSLSCF